MTESRKEARTCAEHGFVLAGDGTCVRCATRAARAAHSRGVAWVASGGSLVVVLAAAGLVRHRLHAESAEVSAPREAVPVAPASGGVAIQERTGAPAELLPEPSASASETRAVLDAWEAERARIDAERAVELQAEAAEQAAAERQRFEDAFRLPDAGKLVARAPAPRVGVTPHDGWPSLPYSAFLADSPDVARRERLWPLFHSAEAEAQAFAAPGRWIPIIRVEDGATGSVSGDWSSSGVIQMKAEKGAGVMFHEIFHPAFHNSEFHTSHTDRDGAWSEAFCDAFRYYAERELLPPPDSRWVMHLDRMTTESESEATNNGTSWTKRKYQYPASVIVKRLGGASGSLAKLRALWFQLVAARRQRGAPVLDDFFGYAPPLHKTD